MLHLKYNGSWDWKGGKQFGDPFHERCILKAESRTFSSSSSLYSQIEDGSCESSKSDSERTETSLSSKHVASSSKHSKRSFPPPFDCDSSESEEQPSNGLVQMGSRHEGCFNNPLSLLQKCSLCFGPQMTESQHRERNDCFVAVDRLSILTTEGSECQNLYDNVTLTQRTKKREITPTRVQFRTTEKSNIFTPWKQRILCYQTKVKSVDKENNNAAKSTVKHGTLSPTQLKDTPITTDSRGSNVESTKNGGMSSMNTLHRRADISVGFFTAATLEAIHSPQSDESDDVTTPRSEESRISPGAMHIAKHSAYKTPAVNRSRLDSEVFRNTIGEVTCEKRVNSDDDVSPIESEEGFSLLLNGDGRKSDWGNEEKSPLGSQVQKRLVYNDGGRDENDDENYIKESSVRHRLVDSTNFNFPEFGAKVIKFVQTFMSNALQHVVQKPEHLRGSHETASQLLHQKTVERVIRHDNLYLRESAIFTNALRKRGRTGACLIQGWVAFRQNMTWRDITLSTRRRDFRYIVLLDDMPILHIFESNRKRKKKQPQVDPLDNCFSIDLSKDIEVRVRLARRDLGHEVYLVDNEEMELICSLLPVAMKDNVFRDKCKSRLAKRSILESVFSKSRSSTEHSVRNQEDQSSRKYREHAIASIKQNDASRHLLFVLSAAITFSPPRR